MQPANPRYALHLTLGQPVVPWALPILWWELLCLPYAPGIVSGLCGAPMSGQGTWRIAGIQHTPARPGQQHGTHAITLEPPLPSQQTMRLVLWDSPAGQAAAQQLGDTAHAY